LINLPISDFINKGIRVVKSNSPEIMTVLGVAGVVTTSYLAAKGSFKAVEVLEDYPFDIKGKEKAKAIWRCYIPAGVCGAFTIGCIVGASKVSGGRTAAAVAAYSITERAFSEYKEKVIEEIGAGKEEKIRDELAQKAVTNNPTKEVIITGTQGNVLCCELLTRRYFRSDMESLRRAMNDINALVIGGTFATLTDFYDIIGLSPTSNSGELGWDSDRLMELMFTTTMSDAGEPCLAFSYNYTRPVW